MEDRDSRSGKFKICYSLFILLTVIVVLVLLFIFDPYPYPIFQSSREFRWILLPTRKEFFSTYNCDCPNLRNLNLQVETLFYFHSSIISSFFLLLFSLSLSLRFNGAETVLFVLRMNRIQRASTARCPPLPHQLFESKHFAFSQGRCLKI